jgi:peptide/nickel transport system permease protein
LYPYTPPQRFKIFGSWRAEKVNNTEYSIKLFITNPAGNNFTLWTKSSSSNQSRPLRIHAGAYEIFQEPGEFIVQLEVKVKPESENAPGTATISVLEAELIIPGLVHGLLGTDHEGRDIFSQLIYGSQISLAVGLSAAVLATSIGILVGVISGYLGGLVDEGMMRTVDILMALPVFPLLLGLIVIFGTSVWYLVLLIALFGWLGLSRIIRARVLSLKEMPFIECARAAGGGNLYIMVKHIIPNVLPVALAALVLSVPAAILTEAGLSFLGFGDPTTPTWGRMLNWAKDHGAFFHLMWWWIVPPGMAITFLTLAFVFIGHAVDEIVNPRLRRRR